MNIIVKVFESLLSFLLDIYVDEELQDHMVILLLLLLSHVSCVRLCATP